MHREKWAHSLAAALALYLALSGMVLAQGAPATQQQFAITGTVAAATKIVSGHAGRQMLVTVVALVPVPTSVVTLTAGTGAACGTSTVALTGALTFSAGQTFIVGNGAGAVFVLPAGFDACITIAAAAAPGSIAVTFIP